jgi:hydroxyethylthiazole kinase
MITPVAVAGDLRRIRAEAPLVHNITNLVVMNTTANALLAVGASPVMAHAIEEVEEMVGLARALVLNIGTLSAPWVEAMVRAGRRAVARGIPVIFDPVGVGATQYRTSTATRLLATVAPTIVRGNASEIRALAGEGHTTKGVDSTDMSDDALRAAQALSRSGCVVTVSGAVDAIVHGDSVVRVANGVPLMTRVTGMGCAATALIGAFAAVNPSPAVAAVHAMVVAGVAGEMAAERAAGPGTFWVHWLDALAALEPSELVVRMRVS